MKRLARTGFAALVLLILQPGIANAGTAGVTSHDHFTYLTYTASPGEANHVTITGANGTYTIHDTAGVTTGQDCARTDASTAICTQTTTNYFPGICINSRDRHYIIRVMTYINTHK